MCVCVCTLHGNNKIQTFILLMSLQRVKKIRYLPFWLFFFAMSSRKGIREMPRVYFLETAVNLQICLSRCSNKDSECRNFHFEFFLLEKMPARPRKLAGSVGRNRIQIRPPPFRKKIQVFSSRLSTKSICEEENIKKISC